MLSQIRNLTPVPSRFSFLKFKKDSVQDNFYKLTNYMK